MDNDSRIRVLSVDGHPILREGVAAIVNSQSDMTIVKTASNGAEAIEAFRVVRPDVTLMDLMLPDLSGIDVMAAIRSDFPEARVIVLTTDERDIEIRRALQAGARAYLLKSTPPKEMLQTVREVHAGRKVVPPEIAARLVEHIGEEPLSDRELQVLQQVAAGNRNRDIAARLFIAEETVKVHLKHIMGKLGANDRTQSVMIAARRGFISL